MRYLFRFFLSYLMLPIFISSVYANPVTEKDALVVAKNWIALNEKPMGELLGKSIGGIKHFSGGKYGEAGYYAVFLLPKGWVIIPADDNVSPILAFGSSVFSEETYESSIISKFFCVNYSTPVSASSSKMRISSYDMKQGQIQDRWHKLRSNASIVTQFNKSAIITGDTLDDLVVSPLLGDNKWLQSLLFPYDEKGALLPLDQYSPYRFYNFKTKWKGKNYPVGCLNLSVGQVLAYFAKKGESVVTYPTTTDKKNTIVGQSPVFLIDNKIVNTNDYDEKEIIVTGGKGGKYDWAKITRNINYDEYSKNLTPNGDSGSDADEVRNEIASLLKDIGLLSQANYGEQATGTQIELSFKAMINHFGFNNLNIHIFDTIDIFLPEEDKVALYSKFINEMNRVLIPNLHAERPVIIGAVLTYLDEADNKQKAGFHSIVIDGYGYQDYGLQRNNPRYFHAYLGLGPFVPNDMWFDFDSSFLTPVRNDVYPDHANDVFGWVKTAVLYNMMPSVEYIGDEKKSEIITGRLWVGGKVVPDAQIQYAWKSNYNESVVEGKVSSNKQGIFAFTTPPGVLQELQIKSSLIQKGSLTNFLDFYDLNIPISRHKENGFKELPEASEIKIPIIIDTTVGNKLIGKAASQLGNTDFNENKRYTKSDAKVSDLPRENGDIVLDTACLFGYTDGIENGISNQFDYPLPWNTPQKAAEWDFDTIKALYISPLDYARYGSPAWLGTLMPKIRQFVEKGGAVFITGDSSLIAQHLSTAAGAGIQFYTKEQVPVYYGAAGLSRLTLHGSLRERLEKDEIVLPFAPYEAGSGGPVFKSIGSATPLAAAEIVLFNYQDPDAYIMKYPVAVTFPLGKGRVYYSSVPIPQNLDTATPGLSASDMPAVREFANWFLSKPIANAERLRLLEAQGFEDIDNTSSTEQEDTTVDKAKSKGLPAGLTAGTDMTVIVGISATVLGKVDYSSIPADYAKNRSWTVSLLKPNGQVYGTQTTSADMIAFPVPAADNTGGTWRIRLGSTTGILDKQLVVSMVVRGLRTIGDGGGTDVPVTGVAVVPTAVELGVGGERQLTATVYPVNATNKTVTWSTSDENVATVDGSGKVKGLTAGAATIHVLTADGNFSADCAVTVNHALVVVTGIQVSPSALSLKEGSTGILSAVVVPNNATNKNVTWTTSDASVATVAGGTVTAHGEGTATITAKTEDGNKTSVCTVTVTKTASGGVKPDRGYYEGKYPGKNVIVVPDDENQGIGTDGDDVIVGGDGNDWLEGGEGNDIYVYNLNGGHDVISNVSGGTNDRNELHFGPGIAPGDLMFDRVGDDLVITLLDKNNRETGSIAIEDWYLAEQNKLWRIVFDDGTILTTEEIENLVLQSGVVGAVHEVRTWEELKQALQEAAPGDEIRLENDIDAPNRKMHLSTFAFDPGSLPLPTIYHDLTIDGNGYRIDFQYSYPGFTAVGPDSPDLSSSSRINVVFRNLTLTKANYKGTLYFQRTNFLLDRCNLVKNGLDLREWQNESEYSNKISGIAFTDGELVLRRCAFVDNTLGIMDIARSKVTMDRVSVNENRVYLTKNASIPFVMQFSESDITARNLSVCSNDVLFETGAPTAASIIRFQNSGVSFDGFVLAENGPASPDIVPQKQTSVLSADNTPVVLRNGTIHENTLPVLEVRGGSVTLENADVLENRTGSLTWSFTVKTAATDLTVTDSVFRGNMLPVIEARQGSAALTGTSMSDNRNTVGQQATVLKMTDIDLTATECTFENNTLPLLETQGGRVTLDTASVLGNRNDNAPQAPVVKAGDTDLAFTECAFNNNTLPVLDVQRGNVTMDRVAVLANQTGSVSGLSMPFVMHFEDSGVSVKNTSVCSNDVSTLIGNRVISVTGVGPKSAEFENCTIYGNSSTALKSTALYGNSIVTGSTIVQNKAGVMGDVLLQGSIVVANATRDIAGTESVVGSGGYNLVGAVEGTFQTVSGDRTGIVVPSVPNIFGLRRPHEAKNNGGFVPTLAIQRNGWADDKIPASVSWLPATDARGIARPRGSMGDIGAFEIHENDEAIERSIPVDGVRIVPETLSMFPGWKRDLSAGVLPANASNQTLTWNSLDPSLASVSRTGEVYAIKDGTATIQVKAEDGNSTAECVISVKRRPLGAGWLGNWADTGWTGGKDWGWISGGGGGGGWGGGGSSGGWGGSLQDFLDLLQEFYQQEYPERTIIISQKPEGQIMEGTDGDDVFVSGPGDDWMEGKGGDDIYIYNPDGGYDIISNVSGNEGQKDELHFGAGIGRENLRITREGDSLVLWILDSAGSITGNIEVEEWFLAEKNKLWRIVFDDGTSLTTEEIEAFDVLDKLAYYRNKYPGRNVVLAPDNGGQLNGTNGDDVLVGGSGSDFFFGGFGNDIFVYNAWGGHDTISGLLSGMGRKELHFGPGIGKTNLVFVLEKNLVVTIYDGSGGGGSGGGMGAVMGSITFENWDPSAMDKLMGILLDYGGMLSKAEINTWLNYFGGKAPGADYYEEKYPDKNVIIAPERNGLTRGTDSDDVLVGSGGNDRLEGGAGSDTYVYNLGGGDDIISNTGGREGDRNVLHFGPAITSDDLSFARKGNDLVISLFGEDDDERGSVTVDGWYLAEQYKLAEIVFYDGTKLSTEEIEARVAPFDGPIPVAGVTLSLSQAALTEGETVSLTATIMPMDATNRSVFWSTSNASVATIVNGTVVAQGEGTATITATTEDGHKTATCIVTVTKKSGGGGGETSGDVSPKQHYYEERYPDRNVIVRTTETEIYGTDGDDVIVLPSEADDGADIWIDPGEGDDIVIYELNPNCGDVVISNVSGNEGQRDELHFGSGIGPENLRFAREGNDMVITVVDDTGAKTGTIEVELWYAAEKNAFWKIVFADGKELSREEVEARAANPSTVLYGEDATGTTVKGTKGDDIIVAYGADGMLLIGDPGSDTYVWFRGCGNVTIDNYSPTYDVDIDTLKFKGDIKPEDIELSRDGELLVFRDVVSGETVTVMKWYRKYDGIYKARLDRIEFPDGTVWTADEVSVMRQVYRGTDGDDILTGSPTDDILYGLDGNDRLNGGAGDDILVGGRGDDTLIGGLGNDVYIWNRGDGYDTIDNYSNPSAPYTDTLRFGMGVKPEDIELRRDGENLILTDRVGGEYITVLKWYRAYTGGTYDARIDRIEFDDGTVWTADEVSLMRQVYRGTDGDDVLTGNDTNDILYGFDGNDRLDGKAGDDILVGGKGNDTLIGGQGNDVYLWNRGDGNDTIDNYSNPRWIYRDILRYGTGIESSDIEATRVGQDLILKYVPTEESITVLKWYRLYGTTYDARLDRVEFSDGSGWDLSETSEDIVPFFRNLRNQ